MKLELDIGEAQNADSDYRWLYMLTWKNGVYSSLIQKGIWKR